MHAYLDMQRTYLNYELCFKNAIYTIKNTINGYLERLAQQTITKLIGYRRLNTRFLYTKENIFSLITKFVRNLWHI
jgi:hypothetical protein